MHLYRKRKRSAEIVLFHIQKRYYSRCGVTPGRARCLQRRVWIRIFVEAHKPVVGSKESIQCATKKRASCFPANDHDSRNRKEFGELWSPVKTEMPHEFVHKNSSNARISIEGFSPNFRLSVDTLHVILSKRKIPSKTIDTETNRV